MSKTIVITGASRGIGKAIATRFAEEGWNLALTCNHSIEELSLLKEELSARHGVTCYTFPFHVGNAREVEEAFSSIYEKFPHIDVLVNNAGISYYGLLSQMSPEDWRNVMSTNLDALFYCSKAVIPDMVGRKEGRIINISSIWGEQGASFEVAYSASKGGCISFTKALAKELAPSNIQVNAITPGVIDTSMNQHISEEERSLLKEEIPTGRFGSCEEVSDVVYFLATCPTYLTGQIIGVNGGWF